MIVGSSCAPSSARAATFYFKAFGILYFMDSVVGAITGQGYLDLGIFRFGPYGYNLIENLPANIPHVVIGGLAIFIGFVLAPRLAQRDPKTPVLKSV